MAGMGLAVLAACAGPAPTGVDDPYEKTNRRVHAFNLSVDKNVIRPIATGTDRIVPDPAGETELVEWLLACGFPVASAEYAGVEAPTPTAQWDSETDVRIRRPNLRDGVQWLISSRSIHSFVTGGMSKDADKLLEIADVLILGQGISERASTRSGIQSCKARLELNAIDIKTGEVLLSKSTYGAGLDVAEHIAGKRALQAAGRQMAIDLLPALAKRWAEIRP